MTNRKTVLVDLDGVVYPFIEVMAQWMAEFTEVNHSPEQLVQLYKSWEVWDDWGIPKGMFDYQWEQGVRAGVIWGKGGPIPGAITNMWRLNDEEWHIHIVTTRLNKFRLYDKAVENTVEWLAAYSVPYRSLSFTEDKHAIEADAIIDDNPDNLIGHPAPLRVLYPAPHNQAWRDDLPVWRDDLPDDFDEVVILQDDPDLNPWDEIVPLLGSGYVSNTNTR